MARLPAHDLEGEGWQGRLARFVVRHRWAIFLAYLLVTACCAVALSRVSFDTSYRVWFKPDDPHLQAYDRFLDTFQNDDAVVIVFTDPRGIYNRRALTTIYEISEKLGWLSHVRQVNSLTHHPHVFGTAESLVIEDLVPSLPLSATAISRVKQACHRDTTCEGLLVSRDGKTTQIVATVEKWKDNTAIVFEIRKDVERILAQVAPNAPYQFRLAGNPILATEYVNHARRDVLRIMPFFLLLLLLSLYAVYRTPLGVLLPITVAGSAILVTLGPASLAGIKINILTTTVPQIILAYGISDAIHLYSTFAHAREAGLDRISAIEQALQKNLAPCFLTSVTTAIGFGSLCISNLVPLQELGLLTAIGVGVEFIGAFALFPALASVSRRLPRSLTSSRAAGFWSALGHFVVGHARLILLSAAVLVALASLGLSRLRVNSDIIALFKMRTTIRQTIEYINDHITGAANYEFVVDTHRPAGIEDPQVLAQAQALQRYILSLGEFTHACSVLDLLQQVNRAVHGDDARWERIPTSQPEAAQLLLLLGSGMPPEHGLTRWISADRSMLRISTRVRHLDTDTSWELLGRIDRWRAKNIPHLEVKVTGTNVMFNHVQEYISTSFINGIILALAMILGVILLIYRSVTLTLIALPANTGPIVITLGLMGATGIFLDFGTAMVASIALGIAVDDTIHLFSRFTFYRRTAPVTTAIPTVLREIGAPMCWSSVVLIIGFTILLGSDFELNSNFGMLVGVVLSVGLLFDIFVTTSLLRLRGRKTRRERGSAGTNRQEING